MSDAVALSHLITGKRRCWSTCRLSIGSTRAFVGLGDERRGDLIEKPTRRVVVGRSEEVARGGMAEDEKTLRPGDSDIGETALLLELWGVAEAAHVREHPFFHPDEKDDRKLETLGVVQGHERHRTRRLHGVDVRNQGRGFEELLQAPETGHAVPGLIAKIGCRPPLFELGRNGQQLLKVFHPAERLDRALAFQLCDVSRIVEDRLHDRPGSIGSSGDQQVHQGDKLGERVGGSRRKTRVLTGALHCLIEGDALGLGHAVDVTNRGVPNTALGYVHDSLHRHRVCGIHDCLEVGHDVLDLAPVVELGTANHLIRHAVADKDFFDDTGLGVGAIEHRHVGSRQAVILERPDSLGDEGRLIVFVLGAIDGDRGALTEVGPEVLRLSAWVVADHRVGGVEDRLRRPVVAVEHDHPGIRIVTLELEDVADVGAAKGVDALIRVPHHAQVVMLRREHLHQPVLGVVGVLVFVHQDVTEAILIVLEHLGESTEQLDRDHEQVVEIHRRCDQQPLLVHPVDLGDLLVIDPVALTLERLKVDQLVLGVADGGANALRREPLGIEVEVTNAPLDQAA